MGRGIRSPCPGGARLWRELEAETGETLLELNGLLEIVTTLEESTASTLDACGVEWHRLEAGEAERHYPVHVPDGSFVVLQPEAGIVRADKALEAFCPRPRCPLRDPRPPLMTSTPRSSSSRRFLGE
jgi:glycine/D-amino acid oxidase-like deaminating enzyme